MSRADMNALLNEAIQVASYFLETHGEFLPFAVAMEPSGEIQHLQGYSEDDSPPAETVIELLHIGLQQSASEGTYKATAVVSDVSISDPDETPFDAIRIELEHAAEKPVTCYLPYMIDNDQVVAAGELTADRGQSIIFIDQV